MEREEEHLRKRREKHERTKDSQSKREMDAVKECTFRPELSKSRRAVAAGTTAAGLATSFSRSAIGSGSSTTASSTCIAGGRGRLLRVNSGLDQVTVRLCRLVEKQRSASSRLRALKSEESDLQDRLSVMRADLHESIQEEETRTVVAMLETNSSDETQHALVQRLRGMVADGTHPEVAQREIVGELVARSQDEIRRLVGEAFTPLQQKAEASLKKRRLAIVQELEAIELDAVALLNTCGSEEALRLGFDPHLAERSRSHLHMEPVAAGSSMVLVAPGEAGHMTRLESPLSSASLSIDQEPQASPDPVADAEP